MPRSGSARLGLGSEPSQAEVAKDSESVVCGLAWYWKLY